METIIQVYDNNGKTWDRYTIVISEPDGVNVYGMSTNPLDPDGFNQWSGDSSDNLSMETAGDQVSYSSLPIMVRKAIANRLIGE